jgi:hypothetical protein
VTKNAGFAFAAAALLWCSLFSCGGSHVGVANATSASVVAAADLLPCDLDVVLRIDWPRLRSSPLYARMGEAISGKGLAKLVRLGPVLDDARAVIVGMRIMSDGVHGDGVLVIEGENTALDPNDVLRADGSAEFRRLPDLRGMSVFERQGDVQRGDAALVVILPHRGILIATPAESDALRRTVRSGADVDRLELPARGLVSFGGRVRQGGTTLLDGAGGRFLLRISDGLGGVSGSVDVSGGSGLSLEADLVYADVASAEKGRDAMRAAGVALESLGPWARAFARSLDVSRRDRLVTVKGGIPLYPAQGPP